MKARRGRGMALSLTGLFRKGIVYITSGRCGVLRYGLQGPPRVLVIIVSLQYQAECDTVTGILGAVEPSDLVQNCSWPRFRVLISLSIFFELRTVPITLSNESVMTFALAYLPTRSRTSTLARFPLAIAENRSVGCRVLRAVLLDRPP